jgi:signal transduction histidine kinase
MTDTTGCEKSLKLPAQDTSKFDSLSVMAGGIAHHFNNKLAAIQGNLELSLLEKDLPPRVTDYLRNALEATHNAAQVSAQLLAYNGNCQPMPGVVNLNLILQEMREQIQSTTPEAITVNWRIPQTSLNVKAVPQQLKKVVANLVQNSVEAIGKQAGVVTIDLTQTPCKKCCHRFSDFREKHCSGKCLKLEVSDSGHGIPPELMDKIFDPFFSTKFPGRGLGLAEVYGIIRTHHGAIQVESAPNSGTTVGLILPEAFLKAPAPPRNWRCTTHHALHENGS